MGWLFKWVVPGHRMAAGIQISALYGIAIGQQHWISGLIRHYLYGEHGHNIRAIREVGNAAETLSFALSAVHGARPVESHHGGI